MGKAFGQFLFDEREDFINEERPGQARENPDKPEEKTSNKIIKVDRVKV